MSEKILIIKWGALGDVILATPHIEAILASYPAAAVSLLTAPAFAPIFASHPRLRVVTFPRKGAVAMWAAMRWVWSQRFTVVYDLQGTERSAVLTRLSGAGKRVGLASRWVYTHNLPDDDRSLHSFQRVAALLARAGVRGVQPKPQVWPAHDEAGKVDAWRTERGLIAQSYVLMHAGSSGKWLSKRWHEASFIALAQKIEQSGLRVIWIGGGDEQALNARLAAQVGIDATGAFSIPGLALLGRQARFAVTGDSGPMHVLSTAGIPVYAMFGPTDWRRCHAVGQESRVLIHPVECSPCYLPACPGERHHACLAGITVDQVLGRLQQDGLLQPDGG